MAVKRRVIWMSDEEWASLQGIAKDRGETISGVIRQFWEAAHRAPVAMSQKQRDAILNQVNRGKRS